MNCQEAQSLVESVIDKRLSGSARRKFDLHLARCAACRAYLVAEQREHTRWFRAFNDPSVCHERLPPDFADRLAKAVIDERPRPFFGRMSRWVRIAACLAGVASLAAFGSWAVVRAVNESADGRLADETVGLVEATTPIDVKSGETVADAGSKPVVLLPARREEAVFSVQQKGIAMKSTLSAVVLAVGSALLPDVALQAASDNSNSCIISGSTERSCATTAWDDSGKFSLDSRVGTHQFGSSFDSFDTRVFTLGYGDPLEEFCSDGPGFTIIIR